MIELHHEELDFDYLKEQLNDEERDILDEYVEIYQDKSSLSFTKYSMKQKLNEHNIAYSESDENDTYFFAFPLKSEVSKEIGPYFGLLVKPNLAILMYNKDNDSLETVDSSILVHLIEKYGEPFATILKIIEEVSYEN